MMKAMRAGCWAAVLVMVAASTSAADRVAVVAVAATDDHLDARARDVTTRLVAAIEARGDDTVLAEVALIDIKTMLACNELIECLRQLGATMGTDAVVAARLSGAPGEAVLLSALWVTSDHVHRARFAVADAALAATAGHPDDLDAKVAAFVERREYRPAGADRLHAANLSPAAAAGASSQDRTSAARFASESPAARIRTRSWMALAGGAAAVTAGAIVLQTGQGRQDGIDAAPTETIADLEALRDEEARARRYDVAGAALLVVGSAVLVTGAVMAVEDAKRTDTADSAPSLTVGVPAGALGSGVLIGLRGSL